MSLTINDILNVVDTNTTQVECPEWGGVVHLATMQSCKYDELEGRLTFARDNPSLFFGLRAEYVGACWADESGKRTPLSPTQVEHLGKKSPIVLDRLFEAARALHTKTEDAEKN